MQPIETYRPSSAHRFFSFRESSHWGFPKATALRYPEKLSLNQFMTPEVLSLDALIQREETVLGEIKQSIKRQTEELSLRLRAEQDRAKELTADMVSTRRDEDKQLIASDEAVSHALKDRYELELKDLKILIDKPYFARVLLEEYDEKSDSFKNVEYRIGAIGNAECRIIDWKKSPLAKLYYEYREGDDFAEEILGKSREGRILEKIQVEIDQGNLKRLSGSFGNIIKKDSSWITTNEVQRGRPQGRGSLPDIAQLITKEQFKAITLDAKESVLIQGVAGSGKTTVALYRLSWLLANKHANQTESLIVVKSPSLKAYIKHSLPLFEMSGVKLKTWNEWGAETLATLTSLKLSQESIPATVARVKRGMFAFFNDAHCNESLTLEQEVLSLLSQTKEILKHDETKLLTHEAIQRAYTYTKENFEKGSYDSTDISLLLNRALKRKRISTKLSHIVVDEAQDFSLLELKCLLGFVKKDSEVTIVGDTAQEINLSGFAGWERLQQILPEGISHFISLNVSHRSTLPIMKLADYVQQRETIKEGREGRVPIWFHSKDAELSLESLITWLKKASDLYPHEVTAVLCKDQREAKEVTGLLSPTFNYLVRRGDVNDISFEAGILVTSIELVKGLEFNSVVLFNPSRKNYQSTGEFSEINRNLLYVGITRAEENLCIVTHERPSEILPPHNSKLVRGITVEPEPEPVEEKRHPLELE